MRSDRPPSPGALVRVFARPVVVRTAALLAVSVAGSSVAAADGSSDAAIGLGLLLLALPVAVAVVWAGVDGVRTGRRARPATPVVRVWIVTAIATGVVQAVQVPVAAALSGGEPTVAVLVDALFGLAPFVAVTVGVPALVTLAVARTVSIPRDEDRSPR
ncbi:hypothetical protein OF117_09820 [Geodermatophilus sp. YIM 151500]|uniref:hypothetical protein n=1 Tax=Geodermatophilus sp. YIM 151500 TaxID=2984531 RepID=UPI0021E41F49|nr:hypothetical protein [Geodermatophilus sp. YIM 151500]MCV2489662.1 hypothetical protein [Geodermatophilus sp. YIM 151500]